jgi:uncharacterized protein (UPF0332 family)
MASSSSRSTSAIRQIKPEKLLEAARYLIDHQPAQGRPRQSYLRRAVSTAYYALFHYLCFATACHLLPNGSLEQRLRIVRSIDHASLRRVCEWIANPNGAPLHVRSMATSLAATNGILNVALAFPDLLQARHEADYDHLCGFSKPAALQHIEAAEAAIRGMKYQKNEKKQMFFALVALEIKKAQ